LCITYCGLCCNNDVNSLALQGEVNVAKVDVTENKELGKRFGIRGFPTLLFFHHGSMYEYSGSRTAEDMTKYATGGFKSGLGKKVPTIPTIFDEVKVHGNTILLDLQTLMSTKKNAILCIFAAGISFGLLLGCLCNCFGSRASSKSKKD